LEGRCGVDSNRCAALARCARRAPVRFVYGALVDARREMDHVSMRVFSTDPEARLGRPRPRVGLDSTRRVRARWIAGRPIRAARERDGILPVTREFEVGDGDDGVRVDLAFRRKIAIPIVLRAPDGRRLVEAFGEKDPDVPLRYLTVLAYPDAPPDRLPLTSAAAADVSSLARWISGPNMRFGNRDDDDVPVDDGVEGSCCSSVRVRSSRRRVASRRPRFEFRCRPGKRTARSSGPSIPRGSPRRSRRCASVA
jgi:hypothetical protein